MSLYGKLRDAASSLSHNDIISIRQALDHTVTAETISPSRAHDLSCILLLCDFNMGLCIRALGGHYTSEFLDFLAIDSALTTLATLPPRLGEPPHNFKLLHQLFHEHVPFKANFRCSRSDTIQRHLYNNHRASDPYLPSIRIKTATDIQKSYSIAFPRWILRMLNGLFLAAIGYATREVKGRIKGRPVNDPSALILGPTDSGALNSHIDRKDSLSMPPVHYQTALKRLWHRVYNL